MLSLFSRGKGSASNVVPRTEDPAPLRSFQTPGRREKMEDHLRRARLSSAPFKYVSLSAKTPRSKDDFLSSVISSRRLVEVERKDLDSFPPFVCRDRVIEFSLVKELPKGYLKANKPWITVEEVVVNFTPAQSATDSFSRLSFELLDGRNLVDPVRRSITAMSNFGVDGVMSMDHSVIASDAHTLKFRVRLHNSVLGEGYAWGSLRLSLKIGQSIEALSVSQQDTIAVLRMPDSSIRDRKTDPNHVDLSMDQEDMNEVKALYKANKIINLSDPVDKQKHVAYSRSEAADSDVARLSDFAEEEPMTPAQRLRSPEHSSPRARSPPPASGRIVSWRSSVSESPPRDTSGDPLKSAVGGPLLAKPRSKRRVNLDEPVIEVIPAADEQSETEAEFLGD